MLPEDQGDGPDEAAAHNRARHGTRRRNIRINSPEIKNAPDAGVQAHEP